MIVSKYRIALPQRGRFRLDERATAHSLRIGGVRLWWHETHADDFHGTNIMACLWGSGRVFAACKNGIVQDSKSQLVTYAGTELIRSPYHLYTCESLACRESFIVERFIEKWQCIPKSSTSLRISFWSSFWREFSPLASLRKYLVINLTFFYRHQFASPVRW